MASYSLSETADTKISAIYEYSITQFGEHQADRYFFGLHQTFEILAEEPYLGRHSRNVGVDIRRFVYKIRIIFYRPTTDGIFVIDIFGERQILPFILDD
jgi:toxin ParE1/3/4